MNSRSQKSLDLFEKEENAPEVALNWSKTAQKSSLNFSESNKSKRTTRIDSFPSVGPLFPFSDRYAPTFSSHYFFSSELFFCSKREKKMRFVRLQPKRRYGHQHHPAAGNRMAQYNYGSGGWIFFELFFCLFLKNLFDPGRYPPFAYHMKWNGPVSLGRGCLFSRLCEVMTSRFKLYPKIARKRRDIGEVIDENAVGREASIRALASKQYSNYTTSDFAESKSTLKNLKGRRLSIPPREISGIYS